MKKNNDKELLKKFNNEYSIYNSGCVNLMINWFSVYFVFDGSINAYE